MLYFTPSLPPTLPSHQSRSHATRLPRLVVVLPLVLCHLSFVSRPPSSVGASVFIVPLFISGVVASQLAFSCAFVWLAWLREMVLREEDFSNDEVWRRETQQSTVRMGGGKRRGKAIRTMIFACTMAKVSAAKMCAIGRH